MLSDADILIGKSFGGYRLEQVIGAGGAGTVYLGVNEGGARAAIKILAPGVKVTSEQLAEFRRRFLREAQLLATLQHPHILSVLASGQDEATGHVYMILPYLSGGTLATRLATGPLPVEDVVRFVTQVASALDYANARGIIHRDIKPANVLLDDNGQAILSDFGIAKLVDALTTQLTMTSQMVGTPEYMAPEQLRAQPATAATDVFGLGALAYSLLTGRTPFQGTSLPEIIQRVMLENPVPLRQLRLEIAVPAEAVILKALAKDPANRFPSAGAMAAALEQGMHGQWAPGVPQPSPTPPTQTADLTATMTSPNLPTVAAVVGVANAASVAAAPPRRRGGRVWLIGLSMALALLLAGGGTAAAIGVITGGGLGSTSPTATTSGQQASSQFTPTLTSVPQATAIPTATAQPTSAPTVTPRPQPTAIPTQAAPTPTATPNLSVQEINNTDPRFVFTGDCGYNHGLSPLLFNDDVQICQTQGDSFTYTFTGNSIYLVTVYYQGHGATISCYIDNSFTFSYNTDSSQGVDSAGFAYGIKLPIAPHLVYGQHTASCKMTSASGTYFFIDAILINA